MQQSLLNMKSPLMKSSNTNQEEIVSIKPMIAALVYFINENRVELPENLIHDLCSTYQINNLRELYQMDSNENSIDSESPLNCKFVVKNSNGSRTNCWNSRSSQYNPEDSRF